MEKVSVIVPVYNVEAYLQRTVDALLGQSWEDLEILLVDDCSRDGSAEVMRRCAERDSRVRCLWQSTNQGVSQARNRGLEEMTGDWFCFCDGDDWFEPDFVEQMLRCAHEEQADYVMCDYQIVSDHASPMAAHSVDAFESGCDPRRVIACGPLSSCTHLFRRSLMEKAQVRYPAGCRQYEELAVVPALARYAERIGVVSRPLYNYYQRSDGSSASNNPRNMEANFRMGLESLEKTLGPGYEAELEYHAVYALLYGEILAMCKQGADSRSIRSRIAQLEQQYPGYEKNPYLPTLGRAKGLFLTAQRMRVIPALRLFAKLHSLYVH